MIKEMEDVSKCLRVVECMEKRKSVDATVIKGRGIAHFFIMAEVVEVMADAGVENVRLRWITTRLFESPLCGGMHLLWHGMHPATLRL